MRAMDWSDRPESQLLGLGNGQRAKQQAVHQRENRRVGPMPSMSEALPQWPPPAWRPTRAWPIGCRSWRLRRVEVRVARIVVANEENEESLESRDGITENSCQRILRRLVLYSFSFFVFPYVVLEHELQPELHDARITLVRVRAGDASKRRGVVQAQCSGWRNSPG